ncbi:hypothetical protein [Microbacterium sp. NPDC077184]|uniref:hypothetical protein n=1 Tax=Microbacterium sp. NPDC077184 TaxID=3154764 RepID=UPI003421325A
MAPRVIVDPTTFVEVEVPPFASDERALRRSRRAANGELGWLRLEPDFGCILPLWSRDGQASELAEELLPAGLRTDLVAWQREWEFSYIYPRGWSAEDARITWSRHGEELYTRLLEEVWDDYEVEPGFRRLT